MDLNFKKEKSGRWYIVLPDWKGSKKDLEMVSGADDMLTASLRGLLMHHNSLPKGEQL